MSYGSSMIWPLAAEYAFRGWAVRRAEWDDETMFGDTGRALRWVIYQNSLFFLLYRAPVTAARMLRVIRNTDFGVDEFYAEDWTVLSPGCSDGYSSPANSEWQQGKKRYPRPLSTVPVVNPLNPNAKYGSCPIVPLYDEIRVVTPPIQTT